MPPSEGGNSAGFEYRPGPCLPGCAGARLRLRRRSSDLPRAGRRLRTRRSCHHQPLPGAPNFALGRRNISVGQTRSAMWSVSLDPPEKTLVFCADEIPAHGFVGQIEPRALRTTHGFAVSRTAGPELARTSRRSVGPPYGTQQWGPGIPRSTGTCSPPRAASPRWTWSGGASTRTASPRFKRRAPLYDRTTRFRVYEPGVIPGLVQTAAYARALMGRIVAFHGIPDDAEQAGAPSSGGLTWVGEPARAAAGMGTREIAPGPGSSGWPPPADLSG
ncbi:Scr1 family TA system antitoxin-like transcriptional regulator [Streptomyces sp. NPDC096136]|uniref:Scr1 family TA system antitoxin-like transcriptional regulator n=1 Tax=Streptomyces sp. NPDC096136 TaxID=3366076 RepID=UPI0037F217E2